MRPLVWPWVVGVETGLASTDRADSGGLAGFASMEWEPPEVVAVFTGSSVRLVEGNDVGFDGFGSEVTGEVEIGESDVARLLNENVFRFEVAIDDTHGMEVVERAEDLSHVESNDSGGKHVVGLAVPVNVEITAGTVRYCPAH